MYRCVNCGGIIEHLDSNYIRCPHCASRMVFKARPPIAKSIKTD